MLHNVAVAVEVAVSVAGLQDLTQSSSARQCGSSSGSSRPARSHSESSAPQCVKHPSSTSHQPPVIHHPSSVISHQSSVISHQSSAISHQPSVISHQSSVILHRLVNRTCCPHPSPPFAHTRKGNVSYCQLGNNTTVPQATAYGWCPTINLKRFYGIRTTS